MAVRLLRLLSPLRSSRAASVVSISQPPLLSLFSRVPSSGRYGSFTNRGMPWIQPASPICSPPRFDFMKQRIFSQGLNLSGKKKILGSVLGFTIVNGMITHQPCTAYALDDDLADFEAPSGYLKDELHTFWALVRKFQLPAVLVITVLLGWRHPLTLAINVALLLFSTRPNPLSVYIFIEQLREREHNRSSRWHMSKFVYPKNIKVEDYKLLCVATVKVGDTKLNLLGILGGWWVVHTSKI